MVTQVTAAEAMEEMLALLDEVVAGQEIEITRGGRTVARIVPVAGSHPLKSSLVGIAKTAATDEMLFATAAGWHA
jgi:prevent-host-death family protein